MTDHFSVHADKLTLDYTRLYDTSTVILHLHRTPAGWHSVTDQNGRLYFPPTPNPDTCLRFMQAFVRKNPGATIDNASVEKARWHRGTLARALTSSGGGPETATDEEPIRPAVLQANRLEPASPPGNVIPFPHRKDAA